MGNNGHTNGKVNGKAVAAPTPSDARTLCRSILNGWLAELQDPAAMREAIESLRAVIRNPATRPGTMALAAKALAEAMNQTVAMGLRLAEFEDKTERLDRGDVTERHGHLVMNVEEARPPSGRITDD